VIDKFTVQLETCSEDICRLLCLSSFYTVKIIVYSSARNELPDFRRDAYCPHYRSTFGRWARMWRYASGPSPYQKYDGIALPSNYY